MGSRLRVLLVEDEVVVGLGLELVLREQGYAVVGFARDSRAAVVLARERRPDLALVDVHLADGDTGPDVARSLTVLGILVVFMTANVELLPQDFAGALGVMPKPVPEHVVAGVAHYVASLIHGNPPERPPRGLILASGQFPVR
ncbi:MAG: response regulator [Pseudomonadota bacterium]|nr:response regulator [Pseudomonadota bacterium]